jgi:hypothetical protein
MSLVIMRLPTVGVARIPHRSRSPRACHHDMISSLVCHPLLFYRSHQWIDSFSPFPAEPCGRGERRDSDQIWRRRRSAGNGENESITDDCGKTKWVANERRNHVMVAGARRSASGWYSADS